MRIISKKKLIEFYSISEYKDSQSSLESWYYEAKNANWETPAEITQKYGTASILKNSRMVFNIGGNKYRLVVKIQYNLKIIFIRFIGTHKQYDSIDADNI